MRIDEEACAVGISPITAGKPDYDRPLPIAPDDRLDDFDCGKIPLNDWLKQLALANEGATSRTFVVKDRAGLVCGYYALAMGSVTRTEVPRKYRQGLPNPVPVMVLGRLGVDKSHAAQGIGGAMLRDALARSIKAGEYAGMRAVIVHAIDDDAITFYTKYGFQIFPPSSQTLFLPVETIAAAIEG